MKLIFQTGLATCVILFSSCAAASSFDNFYAGANVGAASLIDKESTNNPIHDSHDLSALGIVGGGLAGFDFTLRDKLKLGIEGFANAANVNISDNQNYTPVTSYTVNMRNNFGVRLLPGYEFTPGTIGHVILGYSAAKFEINDNGNYGIVNSQFRQNGFQYGLGLVVALFKHLSLRTDVLYTSYGSQTSQGVTTTTPSTTQNYRNNLSTLEGNLAFIFKFC